MTRFLGRAVADLNGGSVNGETERLFAYHHATKHSFHSVRESGHFLDWRTQPDPFRRYEGAELITLRGEPGFPDAGTFETMGALAGTAKGSGREGGEGVVLDAEWLSRLLWYSMAISAWKRVGGTESRYSLRVNPSSGNLHPTEAHVAVRGFAGVEDGLYHYRADVHALEFRSGGAWTRELAGALEIPWTGEPALVVGLTSIFWREAWKYRDRAYRYCCHDLGHAAMSMLLAARALGLAGGVVGHFCDERMTRVLGLGDSDEAPMAFLIFPERRRDAVEREFVPPKQEPAGVPNELSVEEIPYYMLMGMHRSTILAEGAGRVPLVVRADGGGGRDAESLGAAAYEFPLGVTVRRRRSALDFDARTAPMEREKLEQMLDFATRGWRADWRGNFGGEEERVARGADFVTLFLYVHRVEGCAAGVYRWDAARRKLEELHRGNVERVAAFLSLEQGLAGNACFAVSMIADLGEAARVFGNRGYRYAHFEAGAIGQRLYVGAEALGWNATGIGAFYDDDVHRYLGLLDEGEAAVSAAVRAAEETSLVMLGSPASRGAGEGSEAAASLSAAAEISEAGMARDARKLEKQVIYHFAVGRAVEDRRVEG